jgi:hypothetical protein
MTKDCEKPVTHIDNDGYIYCEKHAAQRKSGGVPTRKLKPAEIKKLEQGQTISKYAGCEKLPEGGMRDNCEKKKEEGKESSDKKAEVFSDGTKVTVRNKGKKTEGKVVRFEKGSLHGGSPFYVVDVGEYESLKVPAHEVQKSASKKASSVSIRKTVSMRVRILSQKPGGGDMSHPSPEAQNLVVVTGQISLDFGGDIAPDAIRFRAVLEHGGGFPWAPGLVVQSFQTLKTVSGGGADILLGVLKSALQEALNQRGGSLLDTSLDA